MPPDLDQSAPHRGLRVLVVEDEALIAMDIEIMLERRGWRVLGPAPTVKEALRLLKAETPDVALLDINLRGETVISVAVALRRMAVPFVLSSANDPSETEGGEVLAGAPSVRKPAQELHLVAALMQAAQQGYHPTR